MESALSTAQTETSKYETRYVPGPSISAFMPFVEPLFDSALINSEGVMNMASLRHAIFQGTFHMWVTAEDGVPVGALCTEVLKTDNGVEVNIPVAGFDKNLAAMNNAITAVEDWARREQAHAVKFFNIDRRWDKYAARRGYRTRFVEQYKEL